MDQLYSNFMDITSCNDINTAKSFLEMSNNDIDLAISLYFENGTENDTQMANNLQNELYNDNDNNTSIRQPIEPIHDTLLSNDFSYVPPVRHGGMFGNTQSSIFNQNIIELDSDSEPESSTQKRLANIFRPPWDLINQIDLPNAKLKANKENKLILVNIQDITDFNCQCLNRDFWKNPQLKRIINEKFIFLQYQHDSPSGENYCNLYNVREFPHLAIIDPLTGEKLIEWNIKINNGDGDVNKFIRELEEFNDEINDENEFESLNSVEEEPEEESDIEEIEEIEQPEINNKIQPKELIINHPTTRIQIRSGNGKRIILPVSDTTTIKEIFQHVKYAFGDIINDKEFTLRLQKIDLSECLDKTVEDCGLKNSSILLDVE